MQNKTNNGVRRNLTRAIRWNLIDVLIVFASYMAAIFFRAATTSYDYLGSLRFVTFAVVVSSVMLYTFGVYKRIWSLTSGHGVNVLIKAIGCATLACIALDLLTWPRVIPVSVIILGALLSLFGVTVVRYQSRVLTGTIWRWRAIWKEEFPISATQIRVLIVGAGVAGNNLALSMKHRFPKDTHVYQVVGFVDDDPDKAGLFVEGCPILGTRKDIPSLAEEHHIELIAIALRESSGPDFREILSFCESTKARIKVVPDMFTFMNTTQSGVLLRDVRPEDLIGRAPVSRPAEIDLSLVINKTVLVTGAAGSIGSELCRQLCIYGVRQLLLLDNNESNLHELYIELASAYPAVKLVQILADIAVEYALVDVFPIYQPQIVFHAAAYKHVPLLQHFPREAIRTNIGGTYNLIKFAIEFDVERFVLVSTDKAVRPSNVMGASKRACELMLEAFIQQKRSKTLFTAVRFGNVLGSRGSVLPTFSRQIDSGGPVTVTHPDMKRYFMSIPEAASLVIQAGCLTRGNDTFLLRMGEEVRIIDLAERMIRLRGLRPNIDIMISVTGTRPGEKLNEELYDETETLRDTIHSGIIELEKKLDGFDGRAFLRKIEALVRGDYEDSAEALMTMVTQLPQLRNLPVDEQVKRKPDEQQNLVRAAQ